VSDNGVPDLGGINNEEAFFADEVCITGFFCLLVSLDFVMIFSHLHFFFFFVLLSR